VKKEFSLAPSPIIRAYLASRGRLAPATMALITLEEVASAKPKPPVFKIPATVITPCDPWPRPYYLEDGLRKVYPYHFTYNTFCKERWRDRELIDIFATEFRDRPQTYYVSDYLQLSFWLCRLRRASKMPSKMGKLSSTVLMSLRLRRLSRTAMSFLIRYTDTSLP
jgi:tRNA pseudouridine synthase 9